MKQLRLVRVTEHNGATLGVLCIDGIPRFLTLEDAWKNNEKQVSCIPTGKYKIKSHTSPKFGKTFEVCEVPNRSHILIHSGNTKEDTQGCILLGLTYGVMGDDPAVLSSRAAFEIFMSKMIDEEEADLEII